MWNWYGNEMNKTEKMEKFGRKKETKWNATKSIFIAQNALWPVYCSPRFFPNLYFWTDFHHSHLRKIDFWLTHTRSRLRSCGAENVLLKIALFSVGLLLFSFFHSFCASRRRTVCSFSRQCEWCGSTERNAHVGKHESSHFQGSNGNIDCARAVHVSISAIGIAQIQSFFEWKAHARTGRPFASVMFDHKFEHTVNFYFLRFTFDIQLIADGWERND